MKRWRTWKYFLSYAKEHYGKHPMKMVCQIMSIFFSDLLFGDIKIRMEYWETFLKFVWECRAMEVITGTRKALAFLISVEGKQKVRSFPNSLSPRQKIAMIEFRPFFEVGVSKVVDDILEVVPKEDASKVAIEEALNLINPASGNAVRFVDGRMEILELKQENLMVVAMGCCAAIRCGKIDKKFQMDKDLQNRCTKLVEIHKLASHGIAALPFGLPINMDDCAPLPIPFLEMNRKGERLEPVSVSMIMN